MGDIFGYNLFSLSFKLRMLFQSVADVHLTFPPSGRGCHGQFCSNQRQHSSVLAAEAGSQVRAELLLLLLLLILLLSCLSFAVAQVQATSIPGAEGR